MGFVVIAMAVKVMLRTVFHWTGVLDTEISDTICRI